MKTCISTALLAALSIALISTTPRASAQFPGLGNDTTQSLGQFKIAVNPLLHAALDGSGDPNWSIPLKRYTSPLLYDPTTTIGRSAPHLNGSPADLLGTPVGTLGTIVKDADFSFTPPSFLASPPGTREVHTQIRNLNMTSFFGPAFAVRGGLNAPLAPISIGEVRSNNTAGIGVPAGDFPASSFFDIFVQIDMPMLPGNPLYNDTPLVVEDGALLGFPPSVLYTHGQTNAVPLKVTLPFGPLAAGDVFGIVLIAGHGVDYAPNGIGPGGASHNENDFMSELQIQNITNEMPVDSQYLSWAPGLVPEPSTGLLAAVGLLGLMGRRRRTA